MCDLFWKKILGPKSFIAEHFSLTDLNHLKFEHKFNYAIFDIVLGLDVQNFIKIGPAVIELSGHKRTEIKPEQSNTSTSGS